MDRLELDDPGVRRVAGRRQVARGDYAIDEASGGRVLRERLEQTGKGGWIGADAADYEVRAVVQGRRGEKRDRCEGGDCIEHDDLRPSGLKGCDLRAEVGVGGHVLLPGDDA